MKLLNKVIGKIRSFTPSLIRWYIGPYVSLLAYLFRIYILGNKDAPHVLSIHQTLDAIIKNNLSVIRFGDGEMSIIDNTDLGFQKSSRELAIRLKCILKSSNEGMLICLPGIFSKLNEFAGVAFWFALHHQFRYRHEWLELLSPNQVYGDTFISRPYLGYKKSVREKSGEVFRKFFSIWQGKKVVLVEGDKSRIGVGNDMFKEVLSIKRILGPAENAFLKIEELKQEVLKMSKDNIILLALGPAAKVLAYDLFSAGYRVIDIGHVDMEYEMYIRKEDIETKVKYKYFNEIQERDPEDCNDPEYLKQIITHINL